MIINNGVQYLPQDQSGIKARLSKAKNAIIYRYLKKLVCRAGVSDTDAFCWLELGCGPGNFITQIESWFTNLMIIGVDASQVLLDYAASKTVRARYICAEAESVPIDDESVDIVSLMQVIEHIEQPSIVFEEVNRVLKKQGLFILTTPNLSGLGSIIMKKKWQGYNDKTHISLNTYDNWLNIVKSANFDILSSGTTGLSGIPLARCFPFNLLWQPWQMVFGFFPWKYGESITIIARKK